jgi:hypothetical protein
MKYLSTLFYFIRYQFNAFCPFMHYIPWIFVCFFYAYYIEQEHLNQLNSRVSHFFHFSPNLYAPKICQSLWYKNELPNFSEFSYPVFLSCFQFSLYIGFLRKIQRKSDIPEFFIFNSLEGLLDNFKAGGWIVEILTELLTPVLPYITF